MSEALTQTNPFTLVMDRLWKTLEEEPKFAELVKPRNRVKFTEADPWKDSLTDQDYPEACIIQTTAEVNEHQTFPARTIRQDYEISVITGSMILETLNDLKFSIFKAIERLDGGFKAPSPLAFVYGVRSGNPRDGLAEPQAGQRGRRGWVTVVPVSVYGSFTRASL